MMFGLPAVKPKRSCRWDLPGPSACREPRQDAPSGELKFVRPDAKSQVTVEYNTDGPLTESTPSSFRPSTMKRGGQEGRQKSPTYDEARQLLTIKADPADAAGGPPGDLIDGKGEVKMIKAGLGGQLRRPAPSPATSINRPASWKADRTATVALTGRKIMSGHLRRSRPTRRRRLSGKDPTKVIARPPYMAATSPRGSRPAWRHSRGAACPTPSAIPSQSIIWSAHLRHRRPGTGR